MKECKCKWVRLGDYIEIIDRRNIDLSYGIDSVRGVSNTKEIMPTKASVDGNVISKFYVINPGDFIYNPRTTRMGEKVGLAYNNTKETLLFTFNNLAFRIKENCRNILNPDYLYVIYNRPEFDRYARVNSWGSSTELFGWDEMTELQIPLPSLEEQQKVVNAWKALREIKEQNEAIAAPLMQVCQSYIQELKHKYESVEIGPYMHKSNKNTNGSISRVLGVGQSGFIPPQKIPNENLKNYKVMSQYSICYAPPMYNIKSGAIQLYTDIEPAVCSPIYEVFHVDETNLLPTFLIMWLKRDEFIRYADFYSLGVRNTFSYESMEKVRIPLPPLDVQQSIVNLYNCANEAKKIAEEADKKSREICPALIQYVINK